MGIKNLNKTVERECRHLVKPIPISDFAGSYVAVDLSIIVHKCHSNEYGGAVDRLGTGLLEKDLDDRKSPSRPLRRYYNGLVTIWYVIRLGRLL